MNTALPPAPEARGKKRKRGARGRRYLRARRFVVRKLLHADDPPHPLALGVAIGIFVALIPAIGFQMLLAFILCWLFGANKAIGVPLVWVSNPLTVVPIYLPSYLLGAAILGVPTVGMGFWDSLRYPPAGWWESTRFYWFRLGEIAAPAFLGSFGVALLFGVLTYVLTYRILVFYRMRRWGQLRPPDAGKPSGSLLRLARRKRD